MSNKYMGIILVGILILFIGIGLKHLQTPNKWKLTNEEHALLEPFLKHVMFKERAIYTLIGSKPLTSFPLFYPDVRGQASPSIEELWDRWEKIQTRFPISKEFLLVKKEWGNDGKTNFPECSSCFEIYFINIFQTAWVIQENYELFRQVVGFDFDALQLVLEFEKDPHHFWKKIRTPEYCHLWGLLYGYGKKNAFSYLWKNRHMLGNEQSTEEKWMSLEINTWFTNTEQQFTWETRGYSIEHFPIPLFAYYSQNDPVVKQYEAERDQIKQLYHGKDFVDYTLGLLTQNH